MIFKWIVPTFTFNKKSQKQLSQLKRLDSEKKRSERIFNIDKIKIDEILCQHQKDIRS